MSQPSKPSATPRAKKSPKRNVEPDQASSETARRLTIRSAVNAAQQRYERSGGNPIHVWQAIWMCLQPGESVIPLPRWCTDYLHEAAANIMQLAAGQNFRDRGALGSKQTDELVCQAFGLTQAFSRLDSDTKKIARKLRHDEHRLAGLKHEAALAAVDNLTAGHDGTKKAVGAGKRLLAHIPVGKQHTIREQWKWRTRRPKGKN